MPTQSRLLRISVLVEQDRQSVSENPDYNPTDDEIETRIVDAIAAAFGTQSEMQVEWLSTSSMSLDGAPGCGRCTSCNQWVYDVEIASEDTPTGLCRGATVNGLLLCDECLPKDHPVAF